MTSLAFDMKDDAVYFVPLGGCGFFGANMALYGFRDRWIMVDCGMGFADETMPGVDVLLPDPSFAASLGDKLLGIVLTHGHEDHIGAIESLWLRLKAPLYATKFTAARIRQAIGEKPWRDQAKLHVIADRGSVTLGDFHIQYVPMAHSIPEAYALAITIDAVGTLIHTGDWKIDSDPVESHLTDEETFRKLGDKGVLAVLGDSTNAMVPGHSGSEREVGKNLVELFSQFEGKGIAISCFSTNVARLRSIAEAAKKSGRKVCLIGRSLWNIDEVARETGYLAGVPPFLSDEEADLHSIDKIIYICTGSQGEPRAALTRISSDDHPALHLDEGDVVIFSSRAIPGNERAIDRIKNRLYAKGVNIITDRDARIHVSGHGYRDEFKIFYGWVRPKYAVAVHGEHMQQEKHAELARECGATDTQIAVNGKVIEISQECLRVVGEVKSGVLAIEGGRVVAIDHEAILTRKRMMWNGSAVVTIVVDAKGNLAADPRVTAMGLLDEKEEQDAKLLEEVAQDIRKKIANSPRDLRENDEALSELTRITARKFFQERFDRKPQTRVHLVRI